MEPLAGMLFGVVAKPARAGAPAPRRERPRRPIASAPIGRDEVSLLKLYPHRAGL
ncbi:hypothetical protein [Novosphingobium sp. PC22D]|uniref:hypothetical protein n=1 Tax=Novosphingobium sp. PC22D TaxID=1962403 RepID=UPI001439CDDA|nr:hypothetical protein [Novosphingobium sp. PC22D]